ncbi:hypothetical protein [Erwinia pyrifoliae]|uniref:hypothetical protein n=1 Tax=Erwinia pyrifoliae TaxID=79967 RepID=UPI00019609F1|nr:hypothetical protein [Erwinia pyrifoliae]AUX73170.1 hypothetical protein CPI84_12160 [Erwinia pyrifoliae]MCA8876548.1 hypothetical protein [Erwinia pyrifoliae]UXK11111.1 hypothetical protein NYP80_12300 [Erwinia pyrifoliae]CAX55085.1 conserved uncharacterized protein [Erwinia pyrifoliae Ep1/96]
MARQIAPGYCVVERPGNLDFQARELFRDIRSPAASLFMTLNADTQWLKPGQLLIVADPDTTAPVTTQMLHKLRQAKQNTNNALIGVSTEDAGFLQKHYGMIAGLTSAGDKIFGTAGDVGEKYFSAIEQTLKKIEASYQNQYRTQGTLIGQQFYAERNQLLNQLKELVNKPLLKSLARHSVKFRPYEDMRRALNLSSRSIVHEWSTAGVTGIPGYSTYVGNAAKAARFLKYGGYIGIAFSFAGTSNEVANSCSTGRESECGKIAFQEYSKFALSTGGGIAGGAWGSSAMIGVCAAVGVATVGVGGVACAAVGSVAGGYAGSVAGEKLVNMFLESTGD